MLQLANDELKSTLEELEEIQEKACDEIVPISELDEKDCTVEIKQAAGGVESTLFGEEVKNMYEKYAKLQGLRWTQVTYNIDPTLGKGCKYGRFEVMGLNSYKLFKHEIGVHKVQRVPETENKGRLHSSTCIVVVMPIIPKTFFIDPKDIRIETMRASGAGGQHINKTDSACRATHIPTGIIATNQDERDQHANKDKALETLRERVYKYYAEIEMNKIKDERKQQMGTGDLSEKIRTYNWPNNRITDHRTGSQKYGLDSMFSGELLIEFTDELLEKEKKDWIDLLLQK